MSQIAPESTRVSSPPKSFLGRSMQLFLGTVMPLTVVAIEWSTGFCAGVFFDPIPTIPHVLLAISVGVINLIVWLKLGGAPGRRHLWGFLNALAIGISLYFALMFLPLLLMAVIALAFFGLGLLPLTPLLSFVMALSLRWNMRRWVKGDAPQRVPMLFTGLLTAALLAALLQLPATLTDAGMYMASSRDVQQQRRGLWLLRHFASEDRMLEACYVERSSTWDPFGYVLGISRIGTEAARGVFYRATGAEFQSRPLPRIASVQFARGRELSDDWDLQQGTSTIGPRLRRLTLKDSTIDGVVEPDATVAYLEWTMVFRNDHESSQCEARASIDLPPGAVVSRATLWIDGEPREAAFGGRAEVTEAYREVAIAQRRDPLLVTRSGPDRVLLQCFPIAPKGGEMKIRLGITAPLQLIKAGAAELELPRCVEHNFGIPAETRHGLWITGPRPLQATGSKVALETEEGGYRLRATLTEAALRELVAIQTERRPDAESAWTDEPVAGQKRLIQQTIGERPGTREAAAVFVVDLSADMHTHLSRLAKMIGELPDGFRLAIIGAADEPHDLLGGMRPLDAGVRARIASQLMEHRCPGGADNVPALEQAWEVAAAGECDVIWIRGPQPVLLASTASLAQCLERSSRPHILEWQLLPSASKVAEELRGELRRLRVPRGEPQPLVAALSAPRLVAERREVKAAPAGAVRASGHLARLWAADETERLARSQRAKAVELATAYQLVTGVSGAVVLETRQQYDRHGLSPSDPDSVPVTPEPSMLLLMPAAYLLLRRHGSPRERRR